MKITTLSSTHKKYIKKYGAKKAAEKFDLNLTKAKSYEKKYKSNSYQGKRTLRKSNMEDDSSIFEDEPQVDMENTFNGVNTIGSALGFNSSDLNSGMSMHQGMGNVPQMGMTQDMMSPAQGMPMPGMPMQGMPMQGMPMQGMPMQGMPMQGMPMPGMFQGQPIDQKNVDPLMVEISAPVQNWNGNMKQVQSLPTYTNNLSNLAGGGNKIDLSKLAYFK